MLGNIPIPKGPILNWVKNEYRGEGHETKQTVIQETADLANKILASYAFYIEGPESPGPEHRTRFKDDMETYGKQAVELRKFAQQSNAPQPSKSDVDLMLSAQASLAAKNEETTTAEELLGESLQSVGFSPDVVQFDPKETLDNFFNRIDNDLYLMYYAILEQIVNKSIEYAISEKIDYEAFDELKVSLTVAMDRF
jgi:hypothetical protein